MYVKKSTQATASANGWNFQVNAGIYLMLDNLKEMTYINMESDKEDIELTLSNGRKIYAQAKSVSTIGDERNTLAYLKKALGTLSSVDDGKAKLVYICNIKNPLHSKTDSVYIFNGKYTYSILPEADKQTIIKYAGENFSTKNFEIQILPFFGDGEEKYEALKSKIKEFLIDANVDLSYAKRILNAWISQFITNCSDEKIALSKDKVLYPIIIVLIDKPISENAFEKVCDSDNYEIVQTNYRKFITQKSCDYQFVCRVINDYREKRSSHKNKEDYVVNNWKLYEKEFEVVETDTEVREALIKFLILTIIGQKSEVNKIKEAANL